MDDKNHQINQATIKRRNLIGWSIFAILVILAIFEYISYTLVLMISIPTMSVVVYLNSQNDSSIENNKARLLLLAIALTLISIGAFRGQEEQGWRAAEALKYCYDNSTDTSICDEMNGILNPDPEPTDE